MTDSAPETAQSESNSPSYELYRDARGEWRWRLRGPDGEIEADSGEGFATAERALQSLSTTRTYSRSRTAQTQFLDSPPANGVQTFVESAIIASKRRAEDA